MHILSNSHRHNDSSCRRPLICSSLVSSSLEARGTSNKEFIFGQNGDRQARLAADDAHYKVAGKKETFLCLRTKKLNVSDIYSRLLAKLLVYARNRLHHLCLSSSSSSLSPQPFSATLTPSQSGRLRQNAVTNPDNIRWLPKLDFKWKYFMSKQKTGPYK